MSINTIEYNDYCLKIDQKFRNIQKIKKSVKKSINKIVMLMNKMK